MKNENQIAEGIGRINATTQSDGNFLVFSGLWLGERIWDCGLYITGTGFSLTSDHSWEGWKGVHTLTIGPDAPRHVHEDCVVKFSQGGNTTKYQVGTIRIDLDLLPGESRSFQINDFNDIDWPRNYSCGSSWFTGGGMKIGKSWIYTKTECNNRFAPKS